MPATRPLTIADAETLFELATTNRDFLAPWTPTMPPELEQLEGWRTMLSDLLLEAEQQGSVMPRVILDGSRVIGRITLSNIVRGPLQSCNVGYWVSEADNGRGHATAAVAEVVALAWAASSRGRDVAA